MCFVLDSSLPNQSDYKTSLMDNNGIFRHGFFPARVVGPNFSSIYFAYFVYMLYMVKFYFTLTVFVFVLPVILNCFAAT